MRAHDSPRIGGAYRGTRHAWHEPRGTDVMLRTTAMMVQIPRNGNNSLKTEKWKAVAAKKNGCHMKYNYDCRSPHFARDGM